MDTVWKPYPWSSLSDHLLQNDLYRIYEHIQSDKHKEEGDNGEISAVDHGPLTDDRIAF